MTAAASVGLTTQRIAAALDRVGLKEPVGRRVPNAAIRAGSERVDFPESAAYVRSKSELGVRINLEGREPAGVVPASEYEDVRDELVEALSAVRTPDGKPMFDRVVPREAVFEGPELDRGPDVVTVPRSFDNALVADVGTAQFGEPWEPWNHQRTGVVAAAGEDVADVPLEGASIFDVAPTICALFDVPVDREMDGAALPIVETDESRPYPAYRSESTTATENRSVEDCRVEDRLSDLGYL